MRAPVLALAAVVAVALGPGCGDAAAGGAGTQDGGPGADGGGTDGRGGRPAGEAARAPSYTAVSLDGDSVTLGSLRGDVVLLNVWATWCAPCRREIPELQALHEQHGEEGLRVVGVTVDSRHVEADIRSFIAEFGMTYDIWWDPDQAIIAALDAVGVPVTVLIDREGRIIWRHLGAFEREDPELIEAVAGALSGRAEG